MGGPRNLAVASIILALSLWLSLGTAFLATPHSNRQNFITSRGVGSPASLASPLPGTLFDHLLVIMDENHGINDICGGNPPPCNGPYTPYMNSLANNYSIAQQYLSLVGTSWPDYYGILGAFIPAGCTTGTPGPCYPPAGSLTNTNLVDKFSTAGLTWKGYFETQNIASGCDTTDQEPYTHIHNGFVAFQDITTNTTRCNRLELANPTTCPAGVNGYPSDCILLNDLNSGSAPNYMWLTPNDCNDMRGNTNCTNACSIAGPACTTAGDNYLKSLVPNILNSATFRNSRSALFITFDEGKGFCPLNGSGEDCLYGVWAGPSIKTHYASSTLFNHYSLTKTIEVNWNLTALTNNDANASPMIEFFKGDFSISSNPTTLTILASSKSNSTITLSSIRNFNGTVTLSANSSPSPLGLTLSPSTMTLAGGGTGTSTLTVNAGTVANYTVTVVGTGGSLQHNATLTVVVQDFTISASSVGLRQNSNVLGTSTITILPLNHFNGTVTLASTGTTGLSASISPSTITGGSSTTTLTVFSRTQGNYTAIVSSSSGRLVHNTTISVQVFDFGITISSPVSTNIGVIFTSNITITALNHFTGTVSLTDSFTVGLFCGAISPGNITGSGRAALSCSASSAANYPITVRGTIGSLSHSSTTTIKVGDFNVAGPTGPLVVPVRTNTTTSISVTSLNGYSGNVSLAVTIQGPPGGGIASGGGHPPLIMEPPATPSASLNPVSIPITSGGAGQSNLTIILSGASPGNYTITVSASDPRIFHSIQFTLTATNGSSTITTPTTVTSSTLLATPVDANETVQSLVLYLFSPFALVYIARFKAPRARGSKLSSQISRTGRALQARPRTITVSYLGMWPYYAR